MDDVREAAISVEVKLVGHSKRSDGGLNLRFQTHPHGTPKALKDADLGTRYLMALVELNEQEEPVAPAKQQPPSNEAPSSDGPKTPPTESQTEISHQDSHRLVTRAVMMCKEPKFHTYLRRRWAIVSCNDEESAAKALRMLCGVDSRSELTLGSEAAQRFDNLLHDYAIWQNETGSA
jgi:hypothetical protein